MVILNNSRDMQKLETARFAESIGDAKTGRDVISGQTFDLSGEIPVEGKTPLILELR
jgi:hypothetical protein